MRFISRKDILEKPVGEELILYHPTNEVIHVLNVTAATIFKLCDGSHTHFEITEALQASFEGVDPVQASCDVKRTLDILKTKQLVVSQCQYGQSLLQDEGYRRFSVHLRQSIIPL